MPLNRLSDVKRPDGMVPMGSMSKCVKVDGQEAWARVSLFGRKAEMTLNYVPAVKVNTPVAYENHRFRVERVIVLGLDQQIRLECVEEQP